MVDRIEYADTAPWPTAADGGGPSLQRSSREVIGNDAANWTAALPTPGLVNSGQAPISDSDGDGIPDEWERSHSLDPYSAADANGDVDGDGQTNLSEWTAGTDPRSSLSRLTTEVSSTAQGFLIRFTALPNRSYTIQYRDSLASGGWQKLVDITAEAGERQVTHIDPVIAPERFYRVVTPASP
jgi:hypothetical protein